MSVFDTYCPLKIFTTHIKYRSAIMRNLICSIWFVILSGCCPISAYHQQVLDTPARHVDNGMKLLKIDKFDAAVLEFSRARELDPHSAPAYTGLAIAYGRMGKLDKGYEFIELAQKNACGSEQESAVIDARQQLDSLKQHW
jgi:Tfp pilus assembly protein PilF